MNTNRFLLSKASRHLAGVSILMFTVLAPGLALCKPSTIPDELRDYLIEKPVALPNFILTDSKGNVFDQDHMKGKWSFVFFGYTNCPDVCPETLTELDTAASRLVGLNKNHDKIQYVFISVDPRRDTPKLLGEYLRYFSSDFVGATGSLKELIKLTNAVDIGFEYGPGDKNYEVAHSSAMLLINPQGQYYARFAAPQYSDDIVDGFKLVSQYYQAHHKDKEKPK